MFKFNLTDIKPVAILTAISATLVIVGLITLIVLRYSPKPKTIPSPSPTVIQVAPTPSPRALSTAKQQQPSGFDQELAKIKSILPYKTPTYTIEYLESINIINGKILKADNRSEFIKVRQTAEVFLKSKGVNNLCVLNIFWIPPKNLDPKLLNPTDLLTTNCSASIKSLSSPKP